MNGLERQYIETVRLPLPEPVPKSWMQCIGIQYKELINSRILEFYLDESEEHGFGEVFLRSLFSFLPERFNEKYDEWFERYDVITEQTTNNGRVDLVIYGYKEGSEAATAAVIIENKIEQEVYNPLEDYFDSINVKPTYKTGVVLTIKKESVPDNYVNITHKDLLDQVFAMIGSTLTAAPAHHVTFLIDYYKTILAMSQKEKPSEEMTFLFENGEKISDLRTLMSNQEAILKSKLANNLTKINQRGTTYRLNSTNSHSITLTNQNKKLKIKHFINIENIYSDKTLYVAGYIDKKGNEDLFGRYEKFRVSHKSKIDLPISMTMQPNQNWQKHYKLYEVYLKDITLDLLAILGQHLKEYFENHIVPLEFNTIKLLK